MNPEWIDTGNGDGRQIDLTGMRSAAQSIEDRLLDGITTITPRPRYLAFRAWIVDRYWKARQPDRWEDFIEFSARQEAALSLGLALNGYGGSAIIGIEQAQQVIAGRDNILPIARHTAQTATTIYQSSSETLGLTGSTQTGVIFPRKVRRWLKLWIAR